MVETHPSSSSTRITVGFAVDRVWGVLKTAFDSLAIPTSTVDVSSRTMGNGSMRPRRRLGDVALSKYINCGNVQGGPSADSYEVMLSVLTQLQPAELGQTALLTSVEAQARPITIAGEFTRCTSTGAIEKRLAEIVTSKLNR